MDKTTRSAIERATQQARKLLADDFSSQLEGTFDILASGAIAQQGGAHLSARQHFQRGKIVAAIDHKLAAGMPAVDAVTDYVRDAAFTTLNRFVALKMLEARQLVQECITKGEQSAGYKEFCGMAPALALLPEGAGYRLYIESLFDEFSTEIKVLFDRRDAASVLWPKRATFDALLAILNAAELSGVWNEDETIGWVYQFFNGSDERKQMRDESQAPRNSRELAVRNQFFTPRYVVQFLVDNTLGRMWSEMCDEDTSLVTSCEFFVRADKEAERVRPRKDPRDLRVLDPACGSGHFLLYSFDLLLVMYEEAWGLATGSAPKCDATGRTLKEDYPDIADLRRAAPRLVIEHNLHGVDIDPRCAQIAALALWLRAQRAWKELGIAASDRPRITRTHIVVAEPMPGDSSLVNEFANRLEPPLLRTLFAEIVAESRLAGELGALLRIEDGISKALSQARSQFVKQQHGPAFLPGMGPDVAQGSFDLSGIGDDQFFYEAEHRIIEALRNFAESDKGIANARRRLFVGDAAQGIALVELLRKRFDIILMNPPFGLPTVQTKALITKSYKGFHNDIYAAFASRATQLAPDGLIGCISSRSFINGRRLKTAREKLYVPNTILLWDLGLGVMDNAEVESAAYVLANSAGESLKVKNSKSDSKKDFSESSFFPVDRSTLWKMPHFRMIYNIDTRVSRLLLSAKPFEPSVGTAREGMKTFNNFRFQRLWWEVNSDSVDTRWVRFNNGGENSRFFGTSPLVVSSLIGSRELDAINLAGNGSVAQVRQASSYWFRPGSTYSIRAGQFVTRALPAGFKFTGQGPAILSESKVSDGYILGWLNSNIVQYIVHLQSSKQKYYTGVLKSLPWVDPSPKQESSINQIVSDLFDKWLAVVVNDETSPYFCGPFGTSNECSLSEDAASKYQMAIEAALEKINQIISDLYGFDVTKLDSSDVDAEEDDGGEVGAVDNEGDEIVVESQSPEIMPDERLSFISWCLGVSFGRFSHQTIDKKSALDHLTPFTRLPQKSPAMCVGEMQFAVRDVVVEDTGHPDDLEAIILELWSTRKPFETFDPIEVRSGIRKVFSQHLNRYSAKGRIAPIYWQLSTQSGGYSIWLYAHSVNKDTLYRVVNDFVAPKLQFEQRQLANLTQAVSGAISATARKEIAEKQSFVDELSVFLEEIKRVAPLWAPAADDGVVLTMAPLWRLVPQNKTWQKELKSKWDELCDGQHDWALIAMHLWPERVVPKCAEDRSLAIAHGLEDDFWIQGDGEKWFVRETPKRSIEDLIRNRTSEPVKAALKELTKSPAGSAQPARVRRSAS